ncbi:hypothetical protein H5410_048936 [Solanum commersonii]|uniref:Uncharacterized protein n=1 Tax=Solanum commersonii TaxID=4109 RepID=A0A9J5XN88_SOLCO|nr:hypothetical protein H5410_048936 [Solanum commersonii]
MKSNELKELPTPNFIGDSRKHLFRLTILKGHLSVYCLQKKNGLELNMWIMEDDRWKLLMKIPKVYVVFALNHIDKKNKRSEEIMTKYCRNHDKRSVVFTHQKPFQYTEVGKHADDEENRKVLSNPVSSLNTPSKIPCNLNQTFLRFDRHHWAQLSTHAACYQRFEGPDPPVQHESIRLKQQGQKLHQDFHQTVAMQNPSTQLSHTFQPNKPSQTYHTPNPPSKPGNEHPHQLPFHLMPSLISTQTDTHSAICSALAARGNELYKINLKSNVSTDKHVQIGAKPYRQISTEITCPSSKTGLEGKPSCCLLLAASEVSACDVKCFCYNFRKDNRELSDRTQLLWMRCNMIVNILAKLIIKSKNAHQYALIRIKKKLDNVSHIRPYIFVDVPNLHIFQNQIL